MILTGDRIDTFLPLADTVPESALERLALLGITTLDELRDFWHYGNRQLLVEYLGDSPLRFAAYSPPAGLSRGAAASGPGDSVNLLAAGRIPPLVKRSRGVLLSAAQRSSRAEPPEPMPARRRRSPKTLSLVSCFPTIRDQDQRGTCVAFASAALLEYHLYDASPKTKRHSEQFIYWACKEADGLANVEGTYVRVARRILKELGACYNRTWRYQPLPVGPTEGQGPPPEGAEDKARRFRWPEVRRAAAKDPVLLRQCLDAKKPVVLSVKTFPLWDYPVVGNTGEISMPLPGDQPDGAHAVCLAGYELRSGVPGGGIFIFRNSWGRQWAARAGRFGRGYGTLFFDYVKKYALEAFC